MRSKASVLSASEEAPVGRSCGRCCSRSSAVEEVAGTPPETCKKASRSREVVSGLGEAFFALEEARGEARGEDCALPGMLNKWQKLGSQTSVARRGHLRGLKFLLSHLISLSISRYTSIHHIFTHFIAIRRAAA